MAEQIVFNLAADILFKLGSSAFQQIALAYGVEKELKKLERTMSTVTNVILDAEKQQVTNLAVKGWLKRLKDIVYDFDELLDEFSTKSLLRQVETDSSKMKEVRNFFTKSNPLKVRYSISRKTRHVQEKLDAAVADMEKFKFIVNIVDRPLESRRREETYSFIRDSEVIGRERDKEAIIQTLLCADSEELVVLPLVGMGGLGKTTLARFVYNDRRVVRYFTRRLWVSVSGNFDLKTIIVNILEAAGDVRVNDKSKLEQLQTCLRETLAVRNFFLVLDDIWNDDRMEGYELRNLLMIDGGESRILVTTRSIAVATIMDTVPWYDVKGLSNEDCLSVLGKSAFREGDFNKHSNLVKIGKEIVKKCGGVPLAAMSLGGLLRSKTDEKYWLWVRDNEIRMFGQEEINTIMPVLKLSYDQMPSSLKNCFVYCSLIEKDEVMEKWALIYLWSAQGFIKSSNANEELEVTGEQYLNELVMRSFLQKDGDDDHYRMHSLHHDLALHVAGDECFYLRSGVKSVPEGVRHVSLIGELYSTLNGLNLLKPLLKGKKLRSILLPKLKSALDITSIFNVTYLRVLCLGTGAIMQLSSSIFEDLKHLRYLDLTGLYNRIPGSFTSLVNLQYLVMASKILCELPNKFGNLVNLRYLRISSEMLTNLSETDIGRLINLRILLVSNMELRSLPEGIGRLTRLRILEISYCSMLVSLSSGMRHLTALEHLTIKNCGKLELSEDDLQGLTSLKVLKLDVLVQLKSLPKGLHKDTAASLKHMQIHNCWNMKSLMESFADFTSLEKLDIINCEELSSLPEGMEGLVTLQSLSIKGCRCLTLRCQEGGDDWHKIFHVPYLDISNE